MHRKPGVDIISTEEVTSEMFPFLKPASNGFHQIKRPSNAWIFYLADKAPQQPKGSFGGQGVSGLTKTIGESWAEETEDVQAEYQKRAADHVELHKRLFPNYAFRPSHARAQPE